MNEFVETLSTHAAFGGVQGYYRHRSDETKTPMRLSVFTPPQAAERHVPVLFWLSGLTCTEDNFTVKAGAQRVAAELGLMIVATDTSPRGEGVADDPDGAYDMGLGAGFYVDASQQPWVRHYLMYSYVAHDIWNVIAHDFPSDLSRAGIFGHSMGGHGALTIGLKHPEKYRTISAFAPIVSPMNCPWGEKALGGYLGADRSTWRQYDACALIEDGARAKELLVDQGDKDQFLDNQLKPHLLKAACEKAGIPLTLRLQPGYDHSYFFMASFMEDHLRWHAERLA
jgi:S-formylglutathione hydrolase